MFTLRSDKDQRWRIQDFPQVGAPALGGGTTYNFAKFSQKLGEARPTFYYVDPPLIKDKIRFRSNTTEIY